MAQAVELVGAGNTAERGFADAVWEAVATAAIAFLLLVAIVGLKTETTQNDGLILVSRWAEVFALSAAAGLGRLLLLMSVWRKAPARRVSANAGAVSTRIPLLVVLGLVWIAGAVFFLMPGIREEAGRVVGEMFASAGFEAQARKLFDLVILLGMAVFVIGTAMALVLLVRHYPYVVGAIYIALLAGVAPRVLGWLTAAPIGATAPDATATTFDLMFRTGVLGALFIAATGIVWAFFRHLSTASSVEATTSAPDLLAQYRQQFPAAMLAIAVALPMLIAGPQRGYALDTAMQIMTYVMLGWGLNVVVGLAGLLDLGYVAFYAVGAYSYALISTTFGWSFWVCLPLAGLLAALWGIILGFPVLRLRGDYLAIVTMAFGEIIRIVLLNWVSLTNGPNGVSRIPKPSFFGLSFSMNDAVNFFSVFNLSFDTLYRSGFMYYLILALALFVNAVSMRMRRLPLGRAWEALREDEIACRSLGINTVTTKLTAFAIGAMFGGFAGSFFASRQGFVSPESFTFNEFALVLAIVVLGGMGSQIGVALAAVVLIGASEFFRDFAEYRMLIFGVSMMVIMVWRPRGIVGSRTPSVVLKKTKAISGSLVREGAG